MKGEWKERMNMLSITSEIHDGLGRFSLDPEIYCPSSVYFMLSMYTLVYWTL
jgi:hypothetical protein